MELETSQKGIVLGLLRKYKNRQNASQLQRATSSSYKNLS